MKFKILRVFSLGIVANITLAKDIQILNDHERGVVCGPIYSIGEGSKISFHIENLGLGDEVEIEKIKIPFALLRYVDTAFYDNFPEIKSYNSTYDLIKKNFIPHALIDSDSSKFILERNNISVEGVLDEPIIRTGYLEYKMNQTDFEIDKSGCYCVVIAPIDRRINNLTIPVNYETSLNLTLDNYKVYYNLKVSFIIGFFFTAILCIVLKSMKNDTKSIIPISLIKNILIPILFIHIIRLTLLVAVSYTQLEETKFTFRCLNSIFSWINICVKVTVTYYFPLLFSMGLGIIYLIRETSGHLRRLPYLLYTKATNLLYSHILLSILCSIEGNFLFAKYGVMHLTFLIFQHLNNAMWIVWILYTVYHYFITKISIAKFPSFEELGESKKVKKSFRNSLLVIYSTKLLIRLMEIMNLIKVSIFSANSKLKLLENLPDNYSKVHSITKMLTNEKIMFSIFSWSKTYFSEYIIVIFLFFIWFDYSHLLKVSRS